MVSHDPPATPDESDVCARGSAALLLRADQQPTRADGELTRHLADLLSAVSTELKGDGDSLPTAVRYAAVQLAVHVVQRAGRPDPRRPADVEKAVEHLAPRTDRGKGIPFNRSLRLGRMG